MYKKEEEKDHNMVQVNSCGSGWVLDAHKSHDPQHTHVYMAWKCGMRSAIACCLSVALSSGTSLLIISSFSECITEHQHQTYFLSACITEKWRMFVDKPIFFPWVYHWTSTSDLFHSTCTDVALSSGMCWLNRRTSTSSSSSECITEHQHQT